MTAVSGHDLGEPPPIPSIEGVAAATCRPDLQNVDVSEQSIEYPPAEQGVLRTRRLFPVLVATGVVVAAVIALMVVTSSGPAGPSPRAGAVMFDDPATGQFLMGGGMGTTSAAGLSTMWQWSGKSWTKIPTTIPLAISVIASTAYDPVTRQVLVIASGGSHTWIWQGDSWKDTRATLPENSNDAIAYDPGTRQLLGVFLGPGASGISTWSWDGTSWAREKSAATPSYFVCGMTYDQATKQLIMMLLIPGNAGDVQQPWVWTGDTWQRMGSTTTIGIHRVDDFLGYDQATRQVVAFGENQSGDNETWTWNGVSWLEHPTPTNLLTREAASLAYDTSTGQLLLFGGGLLQPPTYWGDTWRWSGRKWIRLG
jgi:hypothetical protein